MTRRIGISLLVFLLAGCMAGNRDTSKNEHPVSIPAVHTRYLTYPVPSYGIEVEFNPPVLRWPLEKGQQVRYDVRLSQDPLFVDNVISLSETPWAMFNPHTKLDGGKWYWQYRVSGREWSSLNRFIVDETAVALVSPSAEYFLASIPGDHPRVLAGKAEVEGLRKLRAEADAGSILSEADALLKREMPRETDGQPERSEQDRDRAKKLRQDASNSLGRRVYTSVNILCQAWMLSGDERYRRRALAIASEVATWDPEGVTASATNDFSDARCMLVMALVFDTFYDDLSHAEKAALAKAINIRAEGFYRSWVNNQEARILSGHVWQHILHYFFQTALALHGYDPQAGNWLAFAYELFLARTPVLGGKDGGWTEGVSYFKMNMETVIDIPLYIRKYTGFDFFNAHPWYVNNVDWLVYNIPPGSSSDGFGDNAEEVLSPGAEYIAYAKEIAKLTGSSLASWYARECEKYEKPDLSLQPVLRWVRLTKTRTLDENEAPERPELPIAGLFREIGLVSMHSNPANTHENLAVTMRSSPFGCYGHFLSDQNAFNILYGGRRTFFRTGYKVTMNDPHRTGWYQHTKSNNSVLIDGEGQPYSTEAFGWIRKFAQGEQLAYALGDASNAYSSGETGEDHGVRKFYRHLVLLKPDIVVIYDELESQHPAEWSWLIHSMSEIRVDRSGNSFGSTFDRVKGVGKLWSDGPVKLIVRDTFDVPAVNWRGATDNTGKLKSYEENQWHLSALTERRVNRTRFLAVLQISPDADVRNFSEDHDDELLTVQAHGWTVSANLDAATPAELHIWNESQTTRLSYGPDARPVLIETRDGEERTTEAADIFPWYMKQSALFYQAGEHQ